MDFFYKKIKFIYDPVCSDSVLSRCGETSLQLSQGALLYGRGCSAGCEDNFDCLEVKASAVPGRAGWCVDTFDDSVHAPVQPVLGVSWTLLLLPHDVGRTIATVIC